jgi:protein Tex
MKAQVAREAGLEPLAEALLARPDQYPEQLARRYTSLLQVLRRAVKH